jgi:putative acetyltransferase
MLLRRELPTDVVAVRAVHAVAFQASAEGVVVEAVLMDQLRADGAVIEELSLVAVLDGEIVGHVLCSRGSVGGVACAGLGPIGVSPGMQGRGIGAALMHAVLGAADAVGEPAVALLGEPAFYGRFGFVAGSSIGVGSPDPAWGDYFQVRTLTAWQPSMAGEFRYARAFDAL